MAMGPSRWRWIGPIVSFEILEPTVEVLCVTEWCGDWDYFSDAQEKKVMMLSAGICRPEREGNKPRARITRSKGMGA